MPYAITVNNKKVRGKSGKGRKGEKIMNNIDLAKQMGILDDDNQLGLVIMQPHYDFHFDWYDDSDEYAVC